MVAADHTPPTPPSLALVAALALAIAPSVASAQSASVRPASVSLTVVVPPSPEGLALRAGQSTTTVIGRTPHSIEAETRVGADKPASRVEVRLGASWSEVTMRVFVRNAHGQFERVPRDQPVVAFDAGMDGRGGERVVRVRVESDDPLSGDSVVVPIEYRLRLGTGDQTSAWSFASTIRLESPR